MAGHNDQREGPSDPELEILADEPVGELAAETPADTTRRFRCTDMANARRLVTQHGNDVRYCHPHKKWLTWAGQRCAFDEDGEIERRAKRTVRSIYAEASREVQEEVAQTIANWANLSQSAARISAMIATARSEREIVINPANLDADPMVLGATNGVVELETGYIRGPRREDYITKQAGTEFHPGIQCPNWLSFLDDITDHDPKLISYLQRVVGYCLTGLTREQVMFILYGKGANGKSVFLRTVGALLGDYCMITPPETLMTRRNNGGPSPDLARLQGARLVIATEPNEGCVLSETTVKRITGQDKIVCRHLYGNLFEYVPQFKVMLATNHKPIIRGDDHAIWRRIHLIPFDVRFSGSRINPNLIEQLQSELRGILYCATKGALEFQKKGLAPPKRIVEATAEYRADMDVFGDWIEECCVQDPAAITSVSDLYGPYNEWCRASGYHPFGMKRFGMRLADRGYRRVRDSNSRGYAGLSIRAASKDDNAPDEDNTPDENNAPEEDKLTRKIFG